MTREEAKEILTELWGVYNQDYLTDKESEAVEMAIEALREPEKKKGKWLDVPDPYGFFDTIPVCSECGCTTKLRETYKYCPHCGAEMEGRL